MSRFTRRFLLGTGFALCLWTAPAADTVRRLTILHTNDIHAHLLPSERGQGGIAQLAAAIRHERENCPSCILLNAGDLVQGSPVSTIFHGVPIFEISNLLGFDAATLGNHEFDYGWEKTLEFLHIARYPIVCANVVDRQGKLMADKPYVILTANGVRVAVIGALTAEMERLSTPKTRGQWRFQPIVATVRRYVAEVRDRSDVIVLLAHITESEERDVLKALPEIPISITGHDHRGLSAAMHQDGRLAVRIKAYAEELGRLDLQVDVAKKTVVSWDWKHIPIAAGDPVAPDVDREVKRWEAEAARVVDTPIGESRQYMKKREVKALFERAMAEEMHTDFAFVNNGGLRADLPEGRLLARHIWNIMPFDNIVVVAKIKGSQLPEAIAHGRPIDPERMYTLASTDFTAANQAAPGELGTSGLVFSTDGPLLRDVLIEWIKKQNVVGDN